MNNHRVFKALIKKIQNQVFRNPLIPILDVDTHICFKYLRTKLNENMRLEIIRITVQMNSVLAGSRQKNFHIILVSFANTHATYTVFRFMISQFLKITQLTFF